MENLKAGRELDALTAGKVFGCKVLMQAASVPGPYCGCLCEDGYRKGPHGDPGKFDADLPDYSTDIAAAMMLGPAVAAKLEKPGTAVELWTKTRAGYSYAVFKSHTFGFGNYNFLGEHESGGDKLAEAICLAALKAVEAKV